VGQISSKNYQSLVKITNLWYRLLAICTNSTPNV